MSDWADEEGVREWLDHAKKGLKPLEESSVALSIVPDAEGDPKFWIELGAMICMDKPLVVVAVEGREIPPKLRLVADEIVEVDDMASEDARAKLEVALMRVAALVKDES